MSQFKWGGNFNSMDKIARRPVRGSVFGQFEGSYSPDQEQTLKAKFLMAFQDMIPALPTAFSEAQTDLGAMSARLNEQLTQDLTDLGASGQITIVMIQA